MKIARHAQIIKLISQYDIETQEELAQICGDPGDDLKRYPSAQADKSAERKRWVPLCGAAEYRA